MFTPVQGRAREWWGRWQVLLAVILRAASSLTLISPGLKGRRCLMQHLCNLGKLPEPFMDMSPRGWADVTMPLFLSRTEQNRTVFKVWAERCLWWNKINATWSAAVVFGSKSGHWKLFLWNRDVVWVSFLKISYIIKCSVSFNILDITKLSKINLRSQR